MPAGIDRHLRISHRAVVVERVLLDDEAYGTGLIVALEGETVFAGNHVQGFHRVGHGGLSLLGVHRRGRFHLWYDLERPRSLELIEVDDEVGFPFVVGVDHHSHPVANRQTAKNLVVAGGIYNVVAHRVATAVGQEYEGGVVGAVAGQAVKGVVAASPAR